MQTIQPIQDERRDAQTQRLLDAVRGELGLTPNMMKTMAQSPAALEGYLNLSGALANGVFDPQLREQIALTVAQANRCEYSLAAHVTLGRKAGLTEDEILASLEARAADYRTDVALKFVRDLVISRGDLLAENLRRLRDVDYRDRDIVEIVALAALNIFENYFNRVAGTALDFPRAGAGLRMQAA
jgi:AhpD family alkylhydroperoxidase